MKSMLLSHTKKTHPRRREVVTCPEGLLKTIGCVFHCNGQESTWAYTPERLHTYYGLIQKDLSKHIRVVRFSISGLLPNLNEAFSAAIDWTYSGFPFSIIFDIHPSKPVVGGVFEFNGVEELDPTICGLSVDQAYRHTPRGWQATGSFVGLVRELFEDMPLVRVATVDAIPFPKEK